MSEEKGNARAEAVLTRLLQRAGRGPAPSPEARARIYASVRDRWQASVPGAGEGRTSAEAPTADPHPAHSGTNGRPAHRRPRVTTWTRRFALAAGIAAAAAVAYRVQSPSSAVGPVYASVVNSQGRVEVLREDQRRLVSRGLVGIRVGDIVVTDSSAKVALELADGQLLRVDSESEVSFVAAGRVVLERGALYLDSNEAPVQDALRIETSVGSVRHVGTQYETRLDGPRLTIRVREGSVEFSDGGREIEAQAGEQIELGLTGSAARRDIAANDPAWQWAEELATLPEADEYDLDAVLEWVSRETGLTMEFENDAVEAGAASVVLYDLEGLSPREVLAAIENTTALGYRFTDGGLVVTAAER